MHERRSASRRPLGDFVTAIYGDKAALCLGADISERGVFVRSTGAVNDTLSLHEGPVLIHFELPDGSRQWVCGRPRRTGPGSDGQGCGIEFTYVPEKARDHLRRFVHPAA